MYRKNKTKQNKLCKRIFKVYAFPEFQQSFLLYALTCGHTCNLSDKLFVLLIKANECYKISHFLTYSQTGTLVVNLGDALVGWTKGLYRAAKHRVRRSINTDRYSAPFFFNPNADCLIEPIDTNATKDLTYTKVVQGLEMPFRFSDLKMSLLRKSFDWSKDLSPNTLTEK